VHFECFQIALLGSGVHYSKLCMLEAGLFTAYRFHRQHPFAHLSAQ
jgi:hypothetical protein